MFDDLAGALKELREVDLHSLTAEELDEAVVAFAKVSAQVDAFGAELHRVWESEKTWTTDGSRSARAWLAKRTRRDIRDCGRRIWVGKALTDMPLAAAAYAAGEIGTDHIRKLKEVLNPRTEEAFRRDEALLVSWAQNRNFFDFSDEVALWLLEEDPDGCSERDEERRNRRDVRLDQSFGGMWLGKMTLDPISGEIVADELCRLEEEMFHADWAEARERLGREPFAHELRRTPAQRRADALVEMARRSARPKAGNAPKPLIALVMGLDAFRQGCTLASGTKLSPSAVLPYLDDAVFEAILFDANGVAIKASRHRSFTGILRRIIEVRDRRCGCGCGEPAARCQIDHVVPYSAGGWTCQCNGKAQCGPSNRRKGARRGPPLP